MKRIYSFLIILLLLLTGCLPAASNRTDLSASVNWWQDATFYEIFVRSFYDSDGNGIGDFNGITEKLDYLNDGNPNTTADLGITGIWLMPIFPSPSYHGYDVTDYYNVNPQYGTMDDFKKLLDEAHQRGIRVIIDLVINHTSDQHPWFKDAKKDVNSPYRDWYIWSDTDPGYMGPWNERVWHPSLTGYYYGVFESYMPDLNYRNPKVTAEIEKIIDFWLKDVGVDGFRMDAIKHLIEEGADQQNTNSTHEWLKNEFYPTYKAANPNAMAVGELSGDDMNTMAGYVNGKQFDLAFNFQLANAYISSANSSAAVYATRALELSDKVLGQNDAPFLTNHDQNRLMSELGGDVNKARVVASLLLTSPGTPFVYYGEEIGMSGQKPDENIRLPMQWSGQEKAGFSTGKPWRSPAANYPQVNVEIEENDSNSLLSHYRNLINIRNQHPALRTGNMLVLSGRPRNLYAVLRTDNSEKLLVFINLSNEPANNYQLSVNNNSLADGTYQPEVLLGADSLSPITVEGGNFPGYEILPFGTLIIKLNP